MNYGGRGVVVCEEWFNFQNFGLWHKMHYKRGWEIDKDLSSGYRGNLYSPETCHYLPPFVNSMIKDYSGMSSSSDQLGVIYDKDYKTYRVRSTTESGKNIYLGSNSSKLEATKLYKRHRKLVCLKRLEIIKSKGLLTNEQYVLLLNHKNIEEVINFE